MCSSKCSQDSTDYQQGIGRRPTVGHSGDMGQWYRQLCREAEDNALDRRRRAEDGDRERMGGCALKDDGGQVRVSIFEKYTLYVVRADALLEPEDRQTTCRIV